MLDCKEATQLISQGLDRRLALSERMALRLHLLICRGCRATEKHLAFLHNAGAAWRRHHEPLSTQQGDRK